MKKLLISLLFLPTTVWGIEIADCPIGQYPTPIGTQCKDCTNKPEFSNSLFHSWYHSKVILTQTTSKCPWTVSCENAWHGSTNSVEDLCHPCDPNYYNPVPIGIVSTDGTIDTAKYTGTDENMFCQGREYKISLVSTAPSANTLTFYQKYDNGFATTKTATVWGSTFPLAVSSFPTNIKYDLLGYYDAAGKQYVNASGFVSTVTNKTFTADTNLSAKWAPKTYSVTYSNGSTSRTKTRIYTDTVNADASNVPCTVAPYPSDWSIPAGKAFDGWKCSDAATTTCARITADTILKPNDVLQEHTNAISQYTLTPVFTECPAGKYCANGTQNDCPFGKTSPAGSDAESDCTYVAGPMGTIFSDSTGQEFFLPDGTTFN